jgi:hypothetical protein
MIVDERVDIALSRSILPEKICADQISFDAQETDVSAPLLFKHPRGWGILTG